MDRGYRFLPADSAVYSTWVHRKSSTLEEASWVLAAYARDEFRIDDDPSSAEIEAHKRVSRIEKALLESVKQRQSKKKMSPTEWISIARKRGLSVPPELGKFFPDGRDVFQRCEDLDRELSISRAEIASLRKAEQGKAEEGKPLSAKEHVNLLRVVGALLETFDGQSGTQRHPDFKNQAQLIEHLALKYDGISGLSKRQLEKIFPEAKRNL